MSQILVTEDGSHTIFIPELNETYHSIHGAIQESTHVYIERGLHYAVQRDQAQRIRIFELGFGTGLNALLSANYAESQGVLVEFESIEAFPLDDEMSMKLNYPERIPGAKSDHLFQKILESPWNHKYDITPNFMLTKHHVKIQDYSTSGIFDICFFDAFAPSKQAEIWEFPILEKMHSLLSKKGIFVTYCAKGQLKRDLKTLGFEVESLPGPPGKFQMVRATKI